MAQVTMKGLVLGYGERKNKEGKVYRSLRLDVEGKDSLTMQLNIPEDTAATLIPVVQAAKHKAATATVELRFLAKANMWLFDLIQLDVQTGGQPAKA
ncbi:MAG: hypothetical protein EPO64_05060 [Nitrospirae bacterium]|nr:MAG: hypothetical protein EPO64_05060 [Nitrospirota bacterium]